MSAWVLCWFASLSVSVADKWLSATPHTTYRYYVSSGGAQTYAWAKTYCDAFCARVPAIYPLDDQATALAEVQAWGSEANAFTGINGAFLGYGDHAVNGDWRDVYTGEPMPTYGWANSERLVNPEDTVVVTDTAGTGAHAWKWWSVLQNYPSHAYSVVCQILEPCKDEIDQSSGIEIKQNLDAVPLGIITCQPGYSVSGSTVAHCVSDKNDGCKWKWHHSSTCVINTCPALAVDNADVTPVTPVDAGQNADVACKDGYLISGASSVSCGLEGDWDSPPQCIQAVCDASTPIPNGRLDATGEVVAFDQVVVVCDDGYQLDNNEQAVCGGNGVWQPLPRCSKKPCDSLVVANAEPSQEYSAGSKGFVQCLPKFALVGSAHPQCDLDGKWSNIPRCDPVLCVNPFVARGTVTPETAAPTEAVSVVCDEGFNLTGGPLVCGNSGSWENIPSCERVSCPAMLIENGQVPKTYAGAKSEVGCSAKHISNPSEIACGNDGSWSATPTCTKLCSDGFFMGGRCKNATFYVSIAAIIIIVVTAIVLCWCLMKKKKRQREQSR